MIPRSFLRASCNERQGNRFLSRRNKLSHQPQGFYHFPTAAMKTNLQKVIDLGY